MVKYMTCLQQNQDNNSLCREEAKAYLGCRMDNNLMAKEEWTQLGYDQKEQGEATTPPADQEKKN